MDRILYLIKVGELTLKSGNIKDFEQRLVQNARLFLEGTHSNVTLRAGRMYIDAPPAAAEKIEYALTHLVGITGWARSAMVEKTVEAIRAAVLNEAQQGIAAGAKSFKIETRRSDKSFPMTSYELSRLMGEAVYELGQLRVDVHKPDLVITIEIRERYFVYGHTTKGCRGLPCGTGGRALLLLSGGIDSPVAGYRMIRRGMKIDCLYFHSHPYTSPEARKKVENLARILARYSLGTHLNTVPFTAVQERIRETAPPDYATLLLRICMMKVANMLCAVTGAKALITGESVGQVASQTIENIAVTNSYAALPVLRPLIGMDKQEIIDTAEEINTFSTSILPYEDCCVLFSPKHPILRAEAELTEKIFQKMNIDSLLEEAFQQREHIRFGWAEPLADI